MVLDLTEVSFLDSTGIGAIAIRDHVPVSVLSPQPTVRRALQVSGEGERGRQAFIIVKGSATVSVHGTPIASIGPGDFVGEMAMLDRQPRCATVWADTPMEVLAIGPSEFGSFVDDPDVAHAMALQLAARLRRLEQGDQA